MNTAIYYALRTLKQSEIRSFPITSEDIVQLLTESGYSVQQYSTENDATAEKLKKAGLYDIAKQHLGFTYVSENKRIVFLRNTLSATEKRRVLAHELGHIALQHFSPCCVLGFCEDFTIDSAQEFEANNFAVAFLAPPCILKRAHITTTKAIADNTLLDKSSSALAAYFVRDINQPSAAEKELCARFSGFIRDNNRKLYMRFLFVFLLIIILAVVALLPLSTSDSSHQQPQQPQSIPYVTPQPTSVPVTESKVIVTPSGKRYHLPDCHNVKNRTNTSVLDIQAAEALGYTPCKECNP